MEDERTNLCSHFEPLDKTKLLAALESWATKGECFEKHSKDVPRNPNLLINLNTYQVGCNRKTLYKCMEKLYEKDKAKCVTLSPYEGLVWCYQCDASLEEQRQLFDEFHENSKDDRYFPLCTFSDQVEEVVKAFKTKMLAPESSSMDIEGAGGSSSPVLKTSHVFGIQNIGNTCFFNSTQQALNATRELVDYYIKHGAEYKDYDTLLYSRLSCYLREQEYQQALQRLLD